MADDPIMLKYPTAIERRVLEAEAENRELREALNEAIPVLKGFCDDRFTVTADGYAEDACGYTPQGIATLYKLAALRDRISA